ncbi:MAG: hypothetical protein ACRDZ4_03045 [Egibacteraceae bacterium]
MLAAAFIAAFVEGVEALTVVLAMGLSRGWRSALSGVAAAMAMLAAFTFVLGKALDTWLRPDALHLIIGILLLMLGLQWLRKAILRRAGLKALHDEDAEFAKQTELARRAGTERRFGLDWYGFVGSFNSVILEGTEVVLIVFGLTATNVNVPVTTAAATVGAAALAVVFLGLLASGPLSRVPENTLKYIVGLLLSSWGTYWAAEGLGVWRGGESLSWPIGIYAVFVLFASYFIVSRALMALLPRIAHTQEPMPRPLTGR